MKRTWSYRPDKFLSGLGLAWLTVSLVALLFSPDEHWRYAFPLGCGIACFLTAHIVGAIESLFHQQEDE